MAILFTLTVDTEEEWDWNGGWPTENLSLSNIKVLPQFQAICNHYGVSTTYFADHAVLASPAARETLLALTESPGVEIGMHIHPWNTPPLVNHGRVLTRDTFLHNLPVPLIKQKLENVYDCFRKANLTPTSFRGGRFSSGAVTQEFLQDHGFLADASVCPYTTWPDEGAPDYRHRGLEPVRMPPRRTGQRALWEIPLTLAFTRRPFQLWRKWYDLVERSWLRKLRLIGIGERLGIVRKVWLSFESPLGENMQTLLDWLQRQGTQTVCFSLHSSSLIAGGNSFTRTETDAARLFAKLENIFDLLRNNTAFQPATVTEVAQRLEERYHASSGT